MMMHFHANVPLLSPLKTSDNQRFSDIFKGYKNETVEWNGLVSAKSQYFENILLLSDINLMFRCLVSIF